MYKVLTIAGSDSGGGAGIQADLKTISALGGYGTTAITAITAQNTCGVTGVYTLPAEFVARQIDAVMGDIGTDAAKTGMLANAEIVKVVAEKAKEYSIHKLVVDPVVVATSGDRLLTEDAIGSYKEVLFPLAHVVTPNLAEAELFAGISISTVEDMKSAARLIYQLGPKYVLVKGGHIDQDKAVDVLYDGREFHLFSARKVDTENTHGTGCTLSAAIATGLARGLGTMEAVELAKQYVTRALTHALKIGKGRGPVNHFYCLKALEGGGK